MTTKQQLTDLLEATYALHSTPEGPMSLAECFYIASIQTRTIIGGLKVADLVEMVKTSQTLGALILSDHEFMTLIEGPVDEKGSMLLFDDLTFFLFDIEGGLDTDMRGDISWFEGGIAALQPLEDTEIVAASPGLPAHILTPKDLDAQDVDFGTTLRDALCTEISELFDPQMDMEDTLVSENWDTDQQEEIEMWIVRLAAAMNIPLALHISVNAAFEDAPACVDVWLDHSVHHTAPQDIPRVHICKFFEDALHLTTGLSEFQGGSYEYNDGAYGRKSGYSASAGTLFYGTVDIRDMSNHERLSARPTLLKSLQESGVDSEKIQKLMEAIDVIEIHFAEKIDA